MPPNRTTPTARAVSRPEEMGATPAAAWREVEIELDCTMAPPARLASTQVREKAAARGFPTRFNPLAM